MSAKHFHVILLTPDSIPEAIVYYTAMADALEDNEYVKDLTPTIVVFRGYVADLATAQAQVKTIGAKARDVKLKIVKDAADSLRNCVEVVVNANPGKEELIAASAKMAIKKDVGHPKTHDLHIESGDHPGEIKVLMKAAKGKAGYRIRHSLDDEKTYVDDGVSMNTTFVIKGLPIGAKVYVQYAVIIGQDQGPWSDAVSFIVH
jgi:hypothetical protein